MEHEVTYSASNGCDKKLIVDANNLEITSGILFLKRGECVVWAVQSDRVIAIVIGKSSQDQATN